MLSRLGAARRALSVQASQATLLDKLMGDVASQNALNEEFPGLPALAGKPATSPIKVTTLPNGLRVASQDAGGATASIAVHIKAGSRYETVPGTACALESLAFKSTRTRSTAKIQRDVEDIGASVAAKAGRETLVISGEVLRDGVPELASILGEAVTTPKLSYWEVAEEHGPLGAQLEAAACDPLPVLVEGLHAAAFGAASPLGRSQFASVGGLEGITAERVGAFLGERVTGGNTVLSGVNVSHEELLDVAHGYLAGLPEGAGSGAGAPPVLVGGQTLVRSEGAATAHVGLAFGAPGVGSGPKSLAVVGVLQALLGGTGGRAGARHSRLARLAGAGFHATAFAFPYSDGGLLGVVGSGADSSAAALVGALVGALKDAAGGVAVAPGELQRAKAAYKLALVAAAETRAGARDEAAAGLLWAAAPTPLAAQLAAIDAVTSADVAGAAKAALATPVSIAAIGSLAGVPRYDQLVAMLK